MLKLNDSLDFGGGYLLEKIKICLFNKTKINKNAYGFTLAEVLITLGIIGLISAMTIPALINTYNKTLTVVKLKKVYSLLNQALKMAEEQNGPMAGWSELYQQGRDKTEIIVKKYFSPVLKTQEIYPPTGKWQTAMCYTPSSPLKGSGFQYGVLNSPAVYASTPLTPDMTSFTLSDGTCVGIDNRSFNFRDREVHLYFAVDVNGSNKGPNQLGRDYFLFEIANSLNSDTSKLSGATLIPYGGTNLLDEEVYNNKQTGCCKNCTGLYCSARIIKDGWKIKYY